MTDVGRLCWDWLGEEHGEGFGEAFDGVEDEVESSERDGAERRATVEEGSQSANSWLKAHQTSVEGLLGRRPAGSQRSAV